MTRPWLAFSVALLLCSVACRKPESTLPPEPQGTVATPGEVLRLQGTRHVYELELQPPIPEVGQLFEVFTTVRDAKTNAPVVGPSAFGLDATMPHHGHGMTTRPVHTQLDGGRFHTRGMKLHMGGRWVLIVEADGDRAEILWEQPR